MRVRSIALASAAVYSTWFSQRDGPADSQNRVQ